MGQRQERVGDKDSCGEGREERIERNKCTFLELYEEDKHFKVMDTMPWAVIFCDCTIIVLLASDCVSYWPQSLQL